MLKSEVRKCLEGLPFERLRQTDGMVRVIFCTRLSEGLKGLVVERLQDLINENSIYDIFVYFIDMSETQMFVYKDPEYTKNPGIIVRHEA